MPIAKLITATLLHRKVRLALTVAATALAISLVVATTSGYSSARAAAYKFFDDFLGAIDAEVAPVGDQAAGLPVTLLEEIRADDRIRMAYGRTRLRLPVLKVPASREATSGKAQTPAPLATPMSVVGTNPEQDVYFSRLEMSSGRQFTSADAQEVVLDIGAARALDAEVGDFVEVALGAGQVVRLEVVGVVHKPAIVASFMPTAYIPLSLLQDDTSRAEGDRVGEIKISVTTGTDLDELRDDLVAMMARGGITGEVRLTREQREELDRNLQGMGMLSLLGGAVSLLAATFIVFSTVSMGVTERQRTLAMLRAIGASRWQVARLVLGEGAAMTVAGVLAGIPLGWLFVQGLAWFYGDVFSAGVHFSVTGAVIAGCVMVVAALAASLLPAWNATRVDPLEAMSPLAPKQSQRPPVALFIGGALLMGLDSVILFSPVSASMETSWVRDVQFYLHFGIGLPALMLGAFLIAPMVVWLVERCLGPVAAVAFGLRYGLLKQQLSGGLWRAAGTGSALMVGLAVLIVMQTQGNSSISGWKLPDRFPDIFIHGSGLAALDRAAVDALGEAQGIRKLPDGTPDVMPIAYFSPSLGDAVGVLVNAIGIRNTMFLATDPERMFDMMNLDFTVGDRETAVRMWLEGQKVTLADGTVLHGTFQDETSENDEAGESGEATESNQPGTRRLLTVLGEVRTLAAEDIQAVEPGRYLLVTKEFRELNNVGIGDPFPLKRPSGLLGLGREEVVYTITGVVNSPGIDVMVSTYDLGQQFRQQSIASVFGTLEDARRDFGIDTYRLIAANLELGVDKAYILEQLQQELQTQGVAVADVRQVKAEIQTAFGRILLVASAIAWAAMAVASLGVANTIIASIRSRRWQFGILRAIGVTRSGLVRLVLAEALLLGLVGAVLGVVVGLALSVNARQVSVIAIGFDVPIEVPWGIVWVGIGVILAVSLLASLLPALGLARSEPLSLLQGGRASA